MKVEIKYIERTSLDHDAFVKLVEKYAKLKNDVTIVFDKRINGFRTIQVQRREEGSYYTNLSKKTQVQNIL